MNTKSGSEFTNSVGKHPRPGACTIETKHRVTSNSHMTEANATVVILRSKCIIQLVKLEWRIGLFQLSTCMLNNNLGSVGDSRVLSTVLR